MKAPLLPSLAAQLALLLTACGDSAPPPDQLPTAVVHPTAGQEVDIPILSADELAGEYRVAGIDGAPLDEDFGVALSISGDPLLLRFDDECGTFSWAVILKGGVLSATRLLGEPRRCETPIHPRLLQLAEAIDAATRAARTPADGIALTGSGRSVLLFSQ